MKKGIGDWGLGIGDWANPQSPIPNYSFILLFYYSILYYANNNKENYLNILNIMNYIY